MKTRLLLVDDNAEIRRLVRLTFGPERHDIHEAASGSEALMLVHRLRPHLVLLDIAMPGHLDGLELCRRLRTDLTLPGLRIVMLTARGQHNDVAAGYAAGADSYFVKPFSPLDLVDHVEGLLAARPLTTQQAAPRAPAAAHP